MVQKAKMLRSGGQLFFDFFPESWQARAGLSGLLPRGQPHPLSPVKSISSSAVRLLVASVKFEIVVAAEDMAVLNSAIKLFIPDAVAPVSLLEFFAGPLPGVLPGFIS